MTAGGKRFGAGRKLKYGEPTKIVTTKVPVSKLALFKKKVKQILKQWENSS